MGQSAVGDPFVEQDAGGQESKVRFVHAFLGKPLLTEASLATRAPKNGTKQTPIVLTSFG